MRLYYRLSTKEPLVISQSTATTNNHLGLDYIPGSAVLGAIASRLYSQLSKEQSFALFHSGACRFGPVYPLVDNEIALPVPASWHGLKGDAAKLSNHAAPDFVRDETQQYKQRRQGYINHHLKVAEVKQGLTTRTALDADLRVKDGQLYTYTTLQAGQHFGGWIEVDSAEFLDLIKPFLNTELNIGRSRSSEFGRVQLHCPPEQPAVHEINSLGNTVVLWCLSDTQCFDALGSPTFTPDLHMLHPQLEGSLDKGKSFIRTRRVRRFNRARNGLDSEQQLIAAGSVLVYQLNQAADITMLQTLAQQGIGANRQQGLGWVQVNPAWAAQSQPQGVLFKPLVLPPPPQQEINESSTPLLQWVQQQLAVNKDLQEMEQQVRALHQKICAAYESARKYNNLPPYYQAGPGSSQWRRLDELVKNQDNWQLAAFSGEAAVCKAQNDELGWGLSWQQGKQMTNFADFAQQHLSGLSAKAMRKFLEQLCRFDPSDYHSLDAYKKFSQPARQGEQA